MMAEQVIGCIVFFVLGLALRHFAATKYTLHRREVAEYIVELIENDKLLNNRGLLIKYLKKVGRRLLDTEFRIYYPCCGNNPADSDNCTCPERRAENWRMVQSLYKPTVERSCSEDY